MANKTWPKTQSSC